VSDGAAAPKWRGCSRWRARVARQIRALERTIKELEADPLPSQREDDALLEARAELRRLQSL